MKSLYAKIVVVLLMVGLLSACASQATEAPASQPTEQSLPATQAPSQPSLSNNAAAPTEAAQVTQPPAQNTTVSFTNDVLPILESRCVNCHGGDRVEKDLNLKTFTDMMSGSENGPVIMPGDAEHSKLIELIVAQKMPKRGPKLTPPQIQIITEWVNEGAPDN